MLVFDEIKTGVSARHRGRTERYGSIPDLVVIGKAMANGLPLAAVGGRRDVMAEARRTWISSTLATELVGLAAAVATLDVFERESVCGHLHRVGTRLLHGLHRLQHHHRDLVAGVGGMAEMCFLHYANEERRPASRRRLREARGAVQAHRLQLRLARPRRDRRIDAGPGDSRGVLRGGTNGSPHEGPSPAVQPSSARPLPRLAA